MYEQNLKQWPEYQMTRISRFSFASLLLKKILFSAWISFMFINIDIIVEVQGVSDIFFLSMLGRELVDWYALHINNISANKNKHLCWRSVIISFSFFKLTIWSLMINFCRCCWQTVSLNWFRVLSLLTRSQPQYTFSCLSFLPCHLHPGNA